MIFFSFLFFSFLILRFITSRHCSCLTTFYHFFFICCFLNLLLSVHCAPSCYPSSAFSFHYAKSFFFPMFHFFSFQISFFPFFFIQVHSSFFSFLSLLSTFFISLFFYPVLSSKYSSSSPPTLSIYLLSIPSFSLSSFSSIPPISFFFIPFSSQSINHSSLVSFIYSLIHLQIPIIPYLFSSVHSSFTLFCQSHIILVLLFFIFSFLSFS